MKDFGFLSGLLVCWIRGMVVRLLPLALVGNAFCQAPVITNQPQNQTVCVGTDAHFDAGATGAEPLSYQWRSTLDGVNYSDLPGCTNATVLITNAQPKDSLYYQVVITNLEGATNSQFARLYLDSPPLIYSAGQPTNWPIYSLGASVTNRVNPYFATSMTYQWRLNGQPLAGQTKSTIILANLQMADAGSYDVVVGNTCGSVTSLVTTLTVDTTFTKITHGAIVEDSEPSNLPAWGDYDGDGLLDVFVPNNSGTGQNALYRNLGGDEFLRITNVLAAAVGSAWGATCADVDNDGDLDVFIQRPFGLSGGVGARNEMFRNDGGFVFTRMNNAATTTAADWTDATWVDHDGDGWVDLFATTQRTRASAPLEDFFFHNLTDGNFAAWTANDVGAVLLDRSHTAGPAWCDVDGDGDLDLYVSKTYGGETNLLYRNDGGRLVPVTAGSLPARRSTWAAVWADFNNDGLFDLFTGGENGTNMLHFNRGNWVFEDVTVASGLALAGNVYTASAGDFDNDGDLDLYVVVYDGPDVLYVNRGDGTFDRANLGALLAEGMNNGAVWVDYNNDGFLDLFQSCGDGTPARNLLYRNSLPDYGNTNHWLKLCLKGKASNASAIGARILARATIGGRDISQVRQITTACLTPATDGLRVHFGFGDATTVDLVQIEWPSGIVQTLTNVAPNQILPVVEHQEYTGLAPAFVGTAIVTNGLQLSITEPANGARYILEASTNLVTWTKLMARTSAGGTTQFTDARAANYTRRFYRLQVP